MIRVAPVDTARPLRVTLVWTDAAAGAGANPALVNDLDLEVTEIATGSVFRGNVFNNGFSFSDPTNPNDTFDTLNNTECVYLLNPNGTYEIRVVASAITASARPDIATPWQDFALVVDNAEVPAGNPVSVVPVLDRSGSMVSKGYVDITRTSSKQFVDLLNVDDQVGVVSFGDDGVVEYPTGASPSLQTVTGPPIRDAAKTRIDAIDFDGCTYMGDGILKARDLLSGATGNRSMILFSDGYDNKGCNQSDPTRPSALEAAMMLPANIGLYTCAMGAASDQSLLEQLASDGGGRYYFMPTIDDLFEVYNYMRGQVTGEGIIVNESSLASESRVGAFVDGSASTVTFSIAWSDPKLKYVPRGLRRKDEISVRLRDPRGKRIHANAGFVKRVHGSGLCHFLDKRSVTRSLVC